MSRRWAVGGPLLVALVLSAGSAAERGPVGPASASTRPAVVPAAARSLVARTLGAGDRRFFVHRAAHGFALRDGRTRFTRSAVVFGRGSASWSLGLRALGRGDRLAEVQAAVPRAHANHVSYARHGLVEWYANGPLGLEQGFTLSSRPAGTAPLTLELGKLAAGLHARLSRDRRSMSLTRGRYAVLRYRDLVAHDARGRALPARIAVSGGRPSLRIDDRHARYPLRIDPFVETAELTASDGSAGDWFGFSVAISGDTIAVGAQRANAVYVFVQPGGGWGTATETAKLTASDAAPGDDLGSSVAIDGDTIVAGAPGKPVPTQEGAAYVFVKPAGGWGSVPSQHEAAKLTDSHAAGTHELFGYSVAISGDTIAVGAYNAPVGGNTSQGAVFVFVKPLAGWTTTIETAKLTASDGTTGANLGGNAFNGGVAVDGDTIVAGAGGAKVGAVNFQGAVYVFVKPAGGWGTGTGHETAKLTASDGATYHGLGGTAVSVSGGTIAAGGGGSTGAVYVFVEPGSAWADETEAAKLTASDGASGDELGWSVAISGDTIVSGARENANLSGTGAAYVFSKPAGGWGTGTGHEDQKLTSSDPVPDGQLGFGYSVGFDSGTIVVGSPFTDVSAMVGQEGLADVFESGGGGGGGTFALNVSKAGTGSGTVTSSPAGISCGSTCLHHYASGADVTLNAAAAQGSVFSGWSGACSGMTCTVHMSQARSVTATFTSTTPTALFTMPSSIRPGAVTTLNANASLNAKAYRWDLNGDGHTDVSCSTSQLQTQFMPPAGSAASAASSLAQARLTVVSGTGATSTAAQSSPFSVSPSITSGTSGYFNKYLSAYCVNFKQSGICVTPATLTFSVIEASSCDLHQVAGTGDVPEEKALIQTAIDQYNSTPVFVNYVKALCAIAKLVGDPAKCATVSQIDRRDITGLLNTNSILLWESQSPVTIDGLVFTPSAGHAVVISPLLQTIFSGDVEVDLNGRALPLPRKLSLSFHDVNAPLTLNASDDRIAHVAGFNAPKGVLPGVLGLVPQYVDLSFVRSSSDARYTKIATTFGLPHIEPDVFSSLDGVVPTVNGNFRETNANGLLLSDVHGTIAHVGFGDLLPLQIDDVHVDYLATAVHKPLSITGTIGIGDATLSFAPQLPHYPDNGILFWDGGFHSAAATLDLPCPDLCLHLFPGVDLDQIHFGVALDPTVVKGGGRLEVVDLIKVNGGLAFAFPSSAAPWTLDKTQLPELPDDWTPRDFSALTVALAGGATINLPILDDQTLANAYFVYSFPGYIAFGGGVQWDLLGIVSFDGGLSGEVNAVTKRFNFAGHLQTCVADVLCGGAFGVVSSSGAGACFDVGPVSVGGGIQFPDHVYIWPIDGCKWSRFTADNVFDRRLPAFGASVQPYTFTVKAGDPSHAVQLEGATDAPAVHVTGPGGIDVTSGNGACVTATDTVYNGNTCLTVQGKVRILRSPKFKETVLGIEKPTPGTYTVTPVAGSTFAKAWKANDAGSLDIKGSVSGSGSTRTLSYDATQVPGEKITFLDVNAGASKEIGTVAGGGSGNLKFAPAAGIAAHQVVAEVELAGLPVPNLSGAGASAFSAQAASPGGRLTIASFHPPKPPKLGAATHLRAVRHGTTLAVSWHKAPGAVRYGIVLRLGDGTAETLYAKKTSARFAGVARTDSGRVTVRAIAADTRVGKPRHVAFKATAKTATLVAPFPPQRCVVPKVVGLTERAADKALLTAGCAEGKLKKVASKAPKGRVLSQSSAPRSKHALGTKVSLVLSRGR